MEPDAAFPEKAQEDQVAPDTARSWAQATGDAAIALLPAFLLAKALSTLALGIVFTCLHEFEVAATCGAISAGDIAALAMMWKMRNNFAPNSGTVMKARAR